VTAIGFIGTGALGRPIAAKLLAAGHSLTVFDVDTRATAALVEWGARVAASARAVADEAAIVFACLPSPKVSRAVAAEVVLGRSLELYVELSTLGVTGIEAIAAMLGVRGKLLLDNPIVGGAGGSAVAAGNIAAISAGPKEAFERVRPLLEALTTRIFYVGEKPGQAQICKMVNNAIGITGLTIACEAMVMGVKAGIDPKLLLEIVNAGSGRNVATEEKFTRAILPRDFSGAGTIDIGLKDISLYVEALHQLGLPSFVGSTIMDIWQSAKAEDPARSYHSLIQFFERFAGVEVKE
jgi:3-hydroxyisobutyrate dehydrogenase